jgi:hypothetical protein
MPGDAVAAFTQLVAAFSETGPLSPRLVSELGMRLGPLAESRGSQPASREARHLERWLGLIEASAFLGRGGEA